MLSRTRAYAELEGILAVSRMDSPATSRDLYR
jgi:hypothetical protein